MAVSESKNKKTVGCHQGEVNTVISVEDVNRQAQQLGSGVSEETLNNLIKDEPFLKIENLRAGYGKMEILHDFTLKISKGESLCLIGPNGAGKSTVLHSIFGFTKIFSGSISVRNENGEQNITNLTPSEKLKEAGFFEFFAGGQIGNILLTIFITDTDAARKYLGETKNGMKDCGFSSTIRADQA